MATEGIELTHPVPSYSFLTIISYLHIITSHLKARILEQGTFATRQWFGKQGPAATMEELVERCFLYSPC
jgi:hypothetical protein